MEKSITLSYSKMNDWWYCPKYYEYTRVQGIKPKLENPAFVLGSVFHSCMEYYYGGKKRKYLLSYIDHTYSKVKKDFLPQWYNDKLLDDQCKVRAMLRAYVKLFRREEQEVICLEKEVKKYRITKGLYVHAKIDKIVKVDGKLWVGEYKTTSSLDPDFIKHEKLDYQGSLYTEIARTELKKNVKGVKYEIIRKPSNRRKKDENFVDYENRMFKEMINRKNEFFMFLEALRSQDSLNMCTRDLIKVARTIRNAERDDLYYRNTTSCKKYGKCSHIELCCEGWNSRTKKLFTVNKRRKK